MGFLKKTILIFLFFLLAFTGKANAQTNEVNAYLFYGEGCPHCAKESLFLEKIKPEYPNLKIYEFEVYYNQENVRYFKEVGEKLNLQVGAVPFLVIGDKTFLGYGEGITDHEIINRIEECSENICPDSVGPIVNISNQPKEEIIQPKEEEKKEEQTPAEMIDVPFFGEINIRSLSLPVLTIVLAALDGFNPCAMWTLLFLISLLLGMQDKKRMYLLGSAFIISSAFVYFLFLSAWLNLFLLIGFIIWVRLIVGLFALSAGGYYLRDFWVNRSGGCKVTGGEKRRKVFDKLKEIVQTKSFILALGGIILLAAAVNLVELICSAGLPAIYTHVLSLSNLPVWEYYLYLLLYVFIFMLDDLFVFIAAMVTLHAVGIQTKYSRYSHLIGGILMFVIGLLLLLKPEWLMFG